MLDSNIGSFDLLTLARKLVSAHLSTNPKKIGIFVFGFSKKESERVAEAIISAALAASATPAISVVPVRVVDGNAERPVKVVTVAPRETEVLPIVTELFAN